ncbi:hypothetical protein M406DRAFT_339761 [Cryphonectria parasitica EP155]|uniref:glutathione transferase n=1 Tax=Cryphonectria parasitica (strain ATCC 38755 / EP155) TaxID=660469 RepID=A0A9P5CPL0_CRYP1|nr:uncharacterized protein M406DRAFT_339761 [Cryphonectria parasitica EP155]KAF3766594.1 hypothetical protein M406DRAFT_339761 [Cryphonectria parasitica EP155]
MVINPPKPIRSWMAPPGPNPRMVLFLLEELGLNYEIKSFHVNDVKKPPFININPNGRVPAIEDPNLDLNLRDSGGSNQYIIEQYNIDRRLIYTTIKDKHLCNHFLYLQISAQHLFLEKILSVIRRYSYGTRRVLGMLEIVLSAKPAIRAWHEHMVELPLWKRAIETCARLMEEQGL